MRGTPPAHHSSVLRGQKSVFGSRSDPENKLVESTSYTHSGLHAAQKPPLDVSNTSQLRDLAQSAARIFGWDNNKPDVQLNQQFVISQEQLEQIRQLRATED
jgi:hypothetical protein